MRIVGGTYRGRTLYEFKLQNVRPTSDMTRESLFNILRDRISGARFLDLFAGTGAVGIEALSRGAYRVVFNDASRESVALIKKNLEKIKSEDNYEIKNEDARFFLERTSEKFDIVFVDAPYQSKDGLVCACLAEKVLADGGIVIFESDREITDEEVLKTTSSLEIFDRRKYGKARLCFLKRK